MASAVEILQRSVSLLNHLPSPFREKSLSAVLGRVVPYVGTSKMVIEEMTEHRVVVVARDIKPIQNHIRSVHAGAMFLAVETASGFVTAMNTPPTSLPLIKTLRIDFKKRTRGDVRAVATLTEEQRHLIRTEPRGNVDVEVHATDASGEEPILCLATWAWVPRKS